MSKTAAKKSITTPAGVKQFDFSSLQETDPETIADFERELQHLIQDIQTRPGQRGDRKIVLEVVLTPQGDDEKRVDRVWVQLRLKATRPLKRGRVAVMKFLGGGTLGFNPDAVEDPEQGTLNLATDEGEGHE